MFNKFALNLKSPFGPYLFISNLESRNASFFAHIVVGSMIFSSTTKN